jgi:3,4-dihydroxy 2-butanone 4-phosphate synthase/GTP cyclohydrolase II
MQHDSLIIEDTYRNSFWYFPPYEQTQQTNSYCFNKGTWNLDAVLTRIHSSQVNNDLLGTLTNNADKQLDDMFKVINARKGAIILLIKTCYQ